MQRESDCIEKLGAEMKLSHVVGKSFAIDDLFRQGYEAVFIGTGAGLPYFLDIPGENLNGVYSANEFLTRVNLMKAYLFPPNTIRPSIGTEHRGRRRRQRGHGRGPDVAPPGGEERLPGLPPGPGAMPARTEEIENAFEEGVRPRLLTNPVRILGNEKGWVKGIECIKMELGEPDASGRRKPVPSQGPNT